MLDVPDKEVVLTETDFNTFLLKIWEKSFIKSFRSFTFKMEAKTVHKMDSFCHTWWPTGLFKLAKLETLVLDCCSSS